MRAGCFVVHQVRTWDVTERVAERQLAAHPSPKSPLSAQRSHRSELVVSAVVVEHADRQREVAIRKAIDRAGRDSHPGLTTLCIGLLRQQWKQQERRGGE